MSDADELVELGMVVNDAGDSVAVGLQGGKVHLEVANTGREPVEVWLSAADALGLAELLHRTTTSESAGLTGRAAQLGSTWRPMRARSRSLWCWRR